MTHIIIYNCFQFYIRGKRDQNEDGKNNQSTERKHGKNGIVGGTEGKNVLLSEKY